MESVPLGRRRYTVGLSLDCRRNISQTERGHQSQAVLCIGDLPVLGLAFIAAAQDIGIYLGGLRQLPGFTAPRNIAGPGLSR